MKSTKTTRSFAEPAKAAGKLFERKRPLGRSQPRGRSPEALECKRQRDRDPEVRARRSKARKQKRGTLADVVGDRPPHPANNRFTAERKVQFLDWFRQGLSLRRAAEKAGVSAQTVYDHVSTDPDFAEVYLRAQDVNTEMLESTLHEVACSGHVGAILAVLKQRRPARWRETMRAELTGKDGSPIEIEERVTYRKELMATILAAVKAPAEPVKLAAVKK